MLAVQAVAVYGLTVQVAQHLLLVKDFLEVQVIQVEAHRIPLAAAAVLEEQDKQVKDLLAVLEEQDKQFLLLVHL